MPEHVTRIVDFAFSDYTGAVVVPGSVVSIGLTAFNPIMKGVYFEATTMPAISSSCGGNGWVGPTPPRPVFYHLPDATGWELSDQYYGSEVWLPVMQTNPGTYGVPAPNFIFGVFWAWNKFVVLEASDDLVSGSWLPLGTNSVAGCFSGPESGAHPPRFYRVRAH